MNGDPLPVTVDDVGQRKSVVLDYAVTQDMLNNEYNRGLFTHVIPGQSSTNLRVRFREYSGFDDAPWLTVSFVPEPGTLALLALAACLRLLRRSR